MAATAIAPLAVSSPERAIALTAALSLIVAGWLLVARIFRLGVVSVSYTHLDVYKRQTHARRATR